MVYTWEQDALIFGFQPQSNAIENDVRQISKINPEITNMSLKSVWSNIKIWKCCTIAKVTIIRQSSTEVGLAIIGNHTAINIEKTPYRIIDYKRYGHEKNEINAIDSLTYNKTNMEKQI